MRHNRFSLGQKNPVFRYKPLVSIGLFALLLFLLLFGLDSISSETRARQRESLENALAMGVMHYYSLEGHYPDSIDTLRQAYRLVYDQDYFYIGYRYMGDNIYPDITIIEEGS